MRICFSFPVALAAAVVVLLGGCASGLRSGREFISAVRVEDRPVVDPVRSVSGFSDGLACMDKMLRDSSLGTTLITSKIIPDATGQVQVGVKDMVITALSRMSRTSEAFRYVDYEVAYTNQDTVQVLTQALLASNQMSIQPPAIYVSGSVSYMDKNIRIATKGIGMNHEEGGLGYSKDLMASQVALDLHLGDFISRSLIPGLDVANEVALGNKGGGTDAGAKIKKLGIDFSVSDEYSQGTGAGLRALVDLSMIELVGKWARVPYWQCVSLDQAHPEFQRELYKWYSDADSKEVIEYLQTGLRSSGYYLGAVDGLYGEEFSQALTSYQADSGLVPSGNVNFETYERVAKDYVRKDGTGRFKRIGWGQTEADGWAANLANEPRSGAPKWGSESIPPEIEISLGRDPLVFGLGEALQVELLVSRAAHLYCYYKDAGGTVSQIYPNPLQTQQPVQPSSRVRIPDATHGADFSIVMTRPGEEQLLCLAANQYSAQRFPANLRTEGLQPISGFSSLEQIQATIDRQFKGRVGAKLVTWRVASP